jgi:ribosome-binding protein aMBF1 (putative translation factor)
MSKSLKEKHLEMMLDPECAREFALQEYEFQIARVLLRARLHAGMTQKEVAERMGTTQSVVARMESGKPLPSLSSINKFAGSLNCCCEFCR